ncbi:NAD(P)-binding domain-containing protein [Acidothermaceae bacterium B102]|nr:NAD(P)-binding domain-containing protein [Acidothermaceae bacterium B102]
MRYAVLGTGSVGQAIAGKLQDLGHDVVMGSRSADNPTALEWADPRNIRVRTFRDAAAWAERVVNATNGLGSLEALTMAGEDNLRGKVLVDVANAMDLSNGFPPFLHVDSNDSLGEQLQRAFPETQVVKALNTMNASVMVDPGSVPGDHVVLLCGNDADAKQSVTALLGEIGWPESRVLDLGDISNARGTELYLMLWVRLMGPVGTHLFNIAVLRG